jgi:hypothetical protein
VQLLQQQLTTEGIATGRAYDAFLLHSERRPTAHALSVVCADVMRTYYLPALYDFRVFYSGADGMRFLSFSFTYRYPFYRSTALQYGAWAALIYNTIFLFYKDITCIGLTICNIGT